MNRTKVSLIAAIAAATAFGAGAVKAQDTITIAVAGPMTGQYAVFGEQMRRGAAQAVEDINAAGGLLGKQLVLEVGDDACDPKQAVAAANDLVAKGVVFVAGHWCSGSSIPASSVYAEEGVLQISPGSTNPSYTEDAAAKGWNNIFRVCGRDDAQGIVAGKFLAEKFAGKEVAILHDKTAYGKGLADETKKNMNAAGLQEAMYEAYTAGEKDYSALVSKMKQAGIDAIYVGGYHTEAGLIVRQAKQQGLNAQLVSGDAMVDNEFWNITGEAGEGTIFTFQPDPRKSETAKEVVEKFTAQNYDPEGYTLYTYAAVQVWRDAVEAAGTTDVDEVADAIHGNSFETVIGTLEMDEKGDVKDPEYVWYIWENGDYKELPVQM
ncbi:branched-chain amino acid ABC transporter substrate-binding protein [Rhodospirillaceae bacterium SYSU D60014]|uniref:branched-chain amino acid ABC transporter substrate-binding protein n=1 Tax=Virgifigura deserti TaxID=2268457 RepID=UPI000E674ED3